MGFSSYDQVVTALTDATKRRDYWFQKTFPTLAAGGQYSAWAGAGNPGAGAYPGNSLEAQQVTKDTPGALGWANAPVGQTRHAFYVGATPTVAINGTLTFLDRLLYYPGISHTTTATQTLTNPVALPRYADGAGVMAFLEVVTALGTGAPAATLNYTNEAGVAGKLATMGLLASSVVGRLCHSTLFFHLAESDFGIRSVQSVALSVAQSAGVSALVLAKPLAQLPISGIALTERDMLNQLLSMPTIEDGAALMLAFSSAGTGTTPIVAGQIITASN